MGWVKSAFEEGAFVIMVAVINRFLGYIRWRSYFKNNLLTVGQRQTVMSNILLISQPTTHTFIKSVRAY